MSRSDTGTERHQPTSSTSSNEEIALRILGQHFTHPVPNEIVRYSAARELFISDHADLVEEYGPDIYAQAVENLIPSPYYNPRKPEHLERECQRIRAQTPSAPDTYAEMEGDEMPWEKGGEA